MLKLSRSSNDELALFVCNCHFIGKFDIFLNFDSKECSRVQLSEVIFDRFNIETNPEFCNVTIKVWRENGRGSIGNVTIQSFATTEKVLMYLKITLDDTTARNEGVLLNTVFDAKKVFDGVYSNPLARAFTGSFFKSMDFELKFPFKPVNYFFCCLAENS